MSRIFFYPKGVFVWPNPYWRILKNALSKQGVFVDGQNFSFLSLISNVFKKRIIHFHYVYPEYPHKIFGILPGRIYQLLVRFTKWFNNNLFIFRLSFAKKIGYKLIYTVHNIDFHEKPSDIEQKNLMALYRLADRFIVLGKGDVSKIQHFINGKEVDVIPHFYYKNSYSNKVTKFQARSLLDISTEKYVYLFFGSLRRNKGIELLIRVFKRLSIKGVLLIAGVGDRIYTKEIMDLIGGDPGIIFHDRLIPDDEIQKYMNVADIVIFPFENITNSGSFLLAKSFYKPTITMDKGNIRDYASIDTDILVKNEVELGDALKNAPKIRFPISPEEYVKNLLTPDVVAALHKEAYSKF